MKVEVWGCWQMHNPTLRKSAKDGGTRLPASLAIFVRAFPQIKLLSGGICNAMRDPRLKGEMWGTRICLRIESRAHRLRDKLGLI